MIFLISFIIVTSQTVACRWKESGKETNKDEHVKKYSDFPE